MKLRLLLAAAAHLFREQGFSAARVSNIESLYLATLRHPSFEEGLEGDWYEAAEIASGGFI